jgi:hypothetical protein
MLPLPDDVHAAAALMNRRQGDVGRSHRLRLFVAGLILNDDDGTAAALLGGNRGGYTVLGLLRTTRLALWPSPFLWLDTVGYRRRGGLPLGFVVIANE